eukprot:CAMPEP_0172821782 /NCGR_PEP_ID=MMETSP1075-20121228/16212_1 /TAXON_ID=2916 /ORGANISM="Ceratium fusus, Strain PA161109" /LENGTH=103 /DNA_ID=CAMNT_0013662687 /DNA_START=11 /DNA_END=319 /DNA_ORIENTATION=-
MSLLLQGWAVLSLSATGGIGMQQQQRQLAPPAASLSRVAAAKLQEVIDKNAKAAGNHASIAEGHALAAQKLFADFKAKDVADKYKESGIFPPGFAISPAGAPP